MESVPNITCKWMTLFENVIASAFDSNQTFCMFINWMFLLTFVVKTEITHIECASSNLEQFAF